MKYNLDTVEKINRYAFLAVMATLPMPRTWNQIAWIIWLVTWLMEGRFLHRKNLHWGKEMIPVIGLCIWVTWELISLLWAKNYGNGGELREARLSFFIMPLVALYGVNNKYNWKECAIALLIGCISATIMYIHTIFWAQNCSVLWDPHAKYTKPLQWEFYSSGVSHIKHRLFYCTDIITTIVLSLMLYKDAKQRWGKIWTILLCLILLTSGVLAILATGSRSSVLLLMVLGFVAILRLVPRRHRLLTGITTGLASIGILLALFTFHPRMKILSGEWIGQAEKHYTDPGFEPRLMIWHIALEHPQDYILHGLGSCNSTEYLMEKYNEWEGLGTYKDQRYATHNEYLEVLIELGIVALIAFIILWISFPFCQKRDTRARTLALYVGVTIVFNMLTDNFLARIEGVIYLCAILILLINMNQNEEHHPA